MRPWPGRSTCGAYQGVRDQRRRGRKRVDRWESRRERLVRALRRRLGQGGRAEPGERKVLPDLVALQRVPARALAPSGGHRKARYRWAGAEAQPGQRKEAPARGLSHRQGQRSWLDRAAGRLAATGAPGAGTRLGGRRRFGRRGRFAGGGRGLGAGTATAAAGSATAGFFGITVAWGSTAAVPGIRGEKGLQNVGNRREDRAVAGAGKHCVMIAPDYWRWCCQATRKKGLSALATRGHCRSHATGHLLNRRETGSGSGDKCSGKRPAGEGK